MSLLMTLLFVTWGFLKLKSRPQGTETGMRFLLVVLALAAFCNVAQAGESKRDVIFECAETVADHLELDFERFEVAVVDFLPPKTEGAHAHKKGDHTYSYVLFNERMLSEGRNYIRKIVAHEIYHVYQAQRGDLVKGLWKGKDVSGMQYYKRPHEVEAHAEDDDLAKLCR